MHPVCCKEPVKYIRSVPEEEIDPSRDDNVTNLLEDIYERASYIVLKKWNI